MQPQPGHLAREEREEGEGEKRRQPIRSQSLTHFVRPGPPFVRNPSACDLATAVALLANNSQNSLRADVWV